MTEDEEKLFEKAILTWGASDQVEMIIEEMSELIVAIQHWKRNRCGTDKILDELSDVGIMVDQLSLMMDNAGSVASRKRYMRHRSMKVNRLADRIAGRKDTGNQGE
jgi:hypothetical protein